MKNNRQLSLSLCSLFLLMTLPVLSVAQECITNGAPYGLSNGTSVFITKFLTTSRKCALTNDNNAFCAPSATPPASGVAYSVMSLFASAMNTAVSPFCVWSCTTTMVTGCSQGIDGGDGLPVELLEFEITQVSGADTTAKPDSPVAIQNGADH